MNDKIKSTARGSASSGGAPLVRMEQLEDIWLYLGGITLGLGAMFTPVFLVSGVFSFIIFSLISLFFVFAFLLEKFFPNKFLSFICATPILFFGPFYFASVCFVLYRTNNFSEIFYFLAFFSFFGSIFINSLAISRLNDKNVMQSIEKTKSLSETARGLTFTMPFHSGLVVEYSALESKIIWIIRGVMLLSGVVATIIQGPYRYTGVGNAERWPIIVGLMGLTLAFFASRIWQVRYFLICQRNSGLLLKALRK